MNAQLLALKTLMERINPRENDSTEYIHAATQVLEAVLEALQKALGDSPSNPNQNMN